MNKQNNFTIVHIIGALLVIFGHQYVLMGLSGPTLLGWELHGVGVKILFLVSGYLITMSYCRKKSRIEYLIKRIVRLYPAFAFCLVVIVAAMYFVTATPEVYWEGGKFFLLNNLAMRPVFSLPGVFMNNVSPAVNGSLWTMPVELICYFILMPVLDLYQIISRKNTTIANCGMIVLVFALSAFVWYRETFFPGIMLVFWGTDIYSIFPLLLWFLIGSAYYIFGLKKYCNLQLAGFITIIFTIFAGSLRNLLMPYVLGYLVMSFALVEQPFFAKTIKRDICFGLYLFSFPVQQLLLSTLQGKVMWSVNTYIVVATIITWILAEITFNVIEHPTAKLVNKLLAKINKNVT